MLTRTRSRRSYLNAQHAPTRSFSTAKPEVKSRRQQRIGVPRVTFVRIELDRRRALILPVLRLLLPGAGPALPHSRLSSSQVDHKRRDSDDHGIIELGFVRTLLIVLASWLLIGAPLILLIATIVLAFKQKKHFKVVFTPTEIERIWRWEIASGHYPSAFPVDIPLGAHSHEGRTITSVENAGLPASGSNKIGSDYDNGSGVKVVPVGPARFYLPAEPTKLRRGQVHLPRPKTNAALDMDQVMRQCEFPKRYVRDCLAFLRGEAIEVDARRRFFLTEEGTITPTEKLFADVDSSQQSMRQVISIDDDRQFSARLEARQKLTLAHSPPASSALRSPHPSFSDVDIACDPQHPRLIHMYWTGPFTDKPYMAAISFLYTQNLGLEYHDGAHPSATHCRPQLWIWINPGSAAELMPPDNAVERMHRDLQENQWSRPLLNKRWRDIIRFRLWNTTEQFDGAEELNGWRSMSLFNSHGYKYKDSTQKPNAEFRRVGTTDSSHYDRLSVVMSDMARFLLLHRFGGIYIDADTVFLRDWEPLFSWRGAFAYRWSRLKLYNTAVLKMDRASAIGHFVLRTSVENEVDFHPMSVAHYTRDAQVEGLLKMLPDALFDPAWLNTEKYQRDRPAQPYFQKFKEFFEPPQKGRGGPATFDNFFNGAFSYHYHNFWWLPFDPARNYPDLADLDSRPPLSVQEQKTLSWAASLKRTFEAFVRGDKPNVYGEMVKWDTVHGA